ncbi:hypothetical protein [Magnetospirillum sp. SS-4]|uniref:hypothetical protein n=1 Tax=Magnetospirillum sp. SS-4 TaxID=2681465 RepID=UPI0013825051|nr:hypothetical protein [Magnetospirillum sp. SS-4]CAA7614477.1 exported hypothetical protein [Magnetospirillum sp. SS-4]
MTAWLKGWRLIAGMLLLAFVLEAGSWAALRFWFMLRPTDNPRVVEYMRRGHPLLTDNEDLRAAEIGIQLDGYLGYRLLPSYVSPRVNRQYVSIIETDAAGFVHNGDRDANPRLLADPKAKIYRILVLGCSAVYGAANTTNAATLPARLEARLKARWPQVPFQVINAGVLGYQSTQERLSYELYLRELKPSAAIDVTGNCDAKYSAQLPVFIPHWSASLPLTSESYLDYFRPEPSARIFVSNLIQFPEPLYSLAVLHRIIARFGGGTTYTTATAYYYHPEAAQQFTRNMEGLSRDFIADDVLGLFALQPHLGGKKAELGSREREVLAENKEWADALQRHQLDLAGAFQTLAKRHAGQRLRFIDFSDAFDGVNEQTFETFTHPNDLGSDLLAQRIEERFGAALQTDLIARGWLRP